MLSSEVNLLIICNIKVKPPYTDKNTVVLLFIDNSLLFKEKAI